MRNSITVRDTDPGDKSWLQREAHQIGVLMEELVRRLIHEKRTETARGLKLPGAFARHWRRSAASNFRLRSVVATNRRHSPHRRNSPRLAWLIDTNAA